MARDPGGFRDRQDRHRHEHGACNDPAGKAADDQAADTVDQSWKSAAPLTDATADGEPGGDQQAEEDEPEGRRKRKPRGTLQADELLFERPGEPQPRHEREPDPHPGERCQQDPVLPAVEGHPGDDRQHDQIAERLQRRGSEQEHLGGNHLALVHLCRLILQPGRTRSGS